MRFRRFPHGLVLFAFGIGGATAGARQLDAWGALSSDDLIARWEWEEPVARRRIEEALFRNRAEALPALRAVLPSASPAVKRFACAMLARMRDRKALGDIRALTYDPDESVRTRAITVLRILRDRTAAPRIRELLKSVDQGPVLKVSLAAIGELGSPDDAGLVRPFLSHADRHIQVLAGGTLAMLGSNEAGAFLATATNDPDPLVCKSAVQALGFVSTPGARKRLHTIIEDPAGRWKSYAAIGIARQDIAGTQVSKQVAALGALAESRDQRVIQSSLDWLADTDTPDSRQVLRNLSQAHGPRRNRAAEIARAIGIMTGSVSETINTNHLSLHEITTHRQLTLATAAVPIPNASFYTSVHPGSVADMEQGSEDEDDGVMSLGHFYNPVTMSAPWFSLGYGPATENAQNRWELARARFESGLFHGVDGAFHALGTALHYIQDMTSPAHVHDDQHLFGADGFELWGPANIGAYDFSGVTPLTPAILTAAGFVHEAAAVTYGLTTYQAELFDDDVAQPDSEIRRMFPSLHWDDGGFFGDAYWEIENIGEFENALDFDEWWVMPEGLLEDNFGPGGSRRVRGNVYIENTEGMNSEPVPVEFNGAANTLDRTLHQLYGDNLYPLAVAYGAGLLQLFSTKGCVGDADCDFNCDVNLNDYAGFPGCVSGPGWPSGAGCECYDLDGDVDVDLLDFRVFQELFGQ